MRNTFASFVALLAGTVAAMPLTPSVKRQMENIDVTILQFALTLEHLENVFYKEALLKFSESDFKNAGFGKGFFEKLLFVVEDEQSHVGLLTTAIAATGTTPVGACTYNFPYTDVQSFVTLSSVLEGVGTSAYLGAAGLVTDKSILTTAASIMVTEALHTSQQRAAVKVIPAANSLGTPLGANAVFTLAASFIASCPSNNPALPFTAFPPLALDTSSCSGQSKSSKRYVTRNDHNDSDGKDNSQDTKKDDAYYGDYSDWDYLSKDNSPVCPQPSVTETVSFTGSSAIPSGSFLTFVSGLSVISVQATISDVSITAAIPTGLGGQTYVFVTNSEVTGTIIDTDILMGPAIVEILPTPPVIDDNVLRRANALIGVVQ